MYINKIKLQNFRIYNEQEIILNKSINVFYGDNAQGKTNILEAIFLCTFGKSFRTNKVNELIKLGYKLISSDRSLEWDGESITPKVTPVIETYDDHRMAMAFAPASFLFPGIKIKDISVVDKSYPNYWKDLCKAGFSLEKDEKEGTRL